MVYNSKNGWHNKVTRTTLNTITQICFFFFKKLALRSPDISGEEIQKLAEKAATKYSQSYKHVHEYLEVVSRKQGPYDDIVIYEVKELALLALLILCRNLQKKVYFAYVTQPNCYSSLPNSSPPISWLSGDKKLWCWHWCFPTKQ